jgi:subtilisin family serine protease
VKPTIPRMVAAGGTAIAVLLLMAAAPSSHAQTVSPSSVDDLLLPEAAVTAAERVEPSLLAATGPVTVAVELADPSLAEAVGEHAVQDGPDLSSAEQRSHVAELESSQDALLERIAPLGAQEVARAQVASNTVLVDVDASQVLALAQQPGVSRVLESRTYQMDLPETVPHIGAAALQADPGLTGEGVRVALLDSGADYTHARLGGPGTREAYVAAYGTSNTDPRNTTLDGLFPTEKVVGGFDFIGDTWDDPADPLAPDPDPIDCAPPGCTGSHGTHVASIIAGNNGVAPGASLYAYKVCSSVINSCPDAAILPAMDAVLDPNGDGDISDAVDAVNISLGSPYGQIQDAFSGAVANAVRAGVTIVASAGNSANRPYITGSPAATPEAISVAQTHVPSALNFGLRVREPAAVAGIYRNTATVDWAPITDGFEGQLRYGATLAEQLGCFVDANGNPVAGNTGVSPYPDGFFDGQVALIDRGVCAASFKVHNAAEAGAIGVVIVNNIPGDAPSFSFGGPDPFTAAQTIVVGQEVGNAVKPHIAAGVVVAIDPAEAIELVNSMVSTSARGPSMSQVAIKPEIGAPGASVSAHAGDGTGESAFGGTSGAAPMVTGSVALLLEAYPDRTPLELKAALMNTGETDILVNPATNPGELAEITRIGGGEVRVNDAFETSTAAWVAEDRSAGLSFGYRAASHPIVLSKDVTIRNYGNRTRTYELRSSFRFAEDAATGAVRLTMPSRVTVRSGRSATVTVHLLIDPRKLPEWELDGGPNGGNGPLLTAHEFDGYLTVSGGGDRVHLPWHVLPHRASNVQAPSEVRLTDGSGSARLFNAALSGQPGVGEVFALTGTSPRIPDSELPGEGDNFAVVDLAAVGVRYLPEADVLQFGVNTFGQRSHPNYPAEFDVLIDVGRDGTDDFAVFNTDAANIPTAGTEPGQNVVFVANLATGAVTRVAFIDANLNSANATLTAPLSVLGLSEGDQFDFDVVAFDNYFTGQATDAVESMTFTVGQPRFATEPTVEVRPLRTANLAITAVDGGAEASPSQTGVLVLWRDGRIGREAAVIQVR